MKISLNWIKEFTDIKLPIETLVEKIGAQLGAVEDFVDLGERYQGIVVARVVSCDKHEDADKLQVCKIDDGGKVPGIERDENGYVQVVCGAPNVREGLLVAWIPPGATVPSTIGESPFVLETRDIRGAKSNGMLASAHELAISEDHSGILEIDKEAKPGDEFWKVYGLDDYIIDIENKMFTHRPDLFGQLGVAREIAGIAGQQFKSPEWYVNVLQDTLQQDGEALQLEVNNSVPQLVPRFMAVTLSGIEIKKSPIWLQSYLSRVGIRPINNVVDITNYMMMETAQPLHAYDAGKLQAKSLETRMSKKGEKLKLLGGKEIEFEDDSTILITSGDVPVGIGGVMGGAGTEVDEATKTIVLECANFDMYCVRRTAMKYGLFTDAVTRFNKGQSPLQNDRVLARAVNMLRELVNGKVASKVVEVGSEAAKPPASISVTSSFINTRLGEKLSAEAMAGLLSSVEFEVSLNGDELLVVPPFWRTDIAIAEDIVEEVGRLYGYDHLQLELPKRAIKPAKRDEMLGLKAKIRDVLSKAGANEVLTYSFVHGTLLERVGQDKDKAFQLSNALSPQLQYYRMNLTPSLLERIHPNIKAGYDEFAVFEIGKTHIKNEPDPVEPDIPKELNALCCVIAVEGKKAQEYAGAPFYQAKSYLTTLLSKFGVEDFVKLESLAGADLYGNSWLEQLIAPYEPLRSAILRDKQGLVWGVVGEFKQTIKKALKLPAFTAGFEVDPILFMMDKSKGGYIPLPKFPKVQQDISLKVPVGLLYAELYDFLWNNLGVPENTRAELSAVDIYQRESADQQRQEHKQVTFRLTIASYEKTMTDPEVNRLLDEVAVKAREKFGAERL